MRRKNEGHGIDLCQIQQHVGLCVLRWMTMLP